MRKIAVALLLLSGCSYSRPVQLSQITLGPKERPIDTVAGEASASYFLGFHVDGDDTFAAAIADAKKKAGATTGTLYNVFIDRKISCFPACWLAFYTEITTSVYGTLVTYDDPLFRKSEPTQSPPTKRSDQQLF